MALFSALPGASQAGLFV